ncbi:MAG: tyrosine--tRNA ligase [bacterium]|nr:tyrosine--tRNA ligase [bacterium]
MTIDTLLTKGVEEIIDKKHLESALKSGKKLRVKLGIDPTSPNIHIGRAVGLWKLRAFQELGHTAIFIVGDFTGVIGDTSDKDSERPILTEAQVKSNLRTYFKQAYKILDKNKTEVYHNSQWLKKLKILELAKIANLFGLHEFEAREVIAKRMKEGKRVSFNEVLYPAFQGYDSVAVKADVELGGTDQRFNLLIGRRVQEFYGQKPQDIIMLSIMEGTDGRKMSSSWGNVINLTDDPDNMFGRIMSIPDNLIEKYFLLATPLAQQEVDQIIKSHTNPKDQKEILAKTIVGLYHSEKVAAAAQNNFEKKFGKGHGEIKADFELKKAGGKYVVTELLVTGKLAISKGEAKRKIREGAVEIDGKKIDNIHAVAEVKKNSLIRLGKRFLRIK